MKLTVKQYNQILRHYKKRVPKTLRHKRKRVETLMAKKMCSCIKKVKGYERTTTTKTRKKQPLLESSKIAICNKSIFKNRGLKYNRITCKKGARFIGNKKTGVKLNKTRKHIF